MGLFSVDPLMNYCQPQESCLTAYMPRSKVSGYRNVFFLVVPLGHFLYSTWKVSQGGLFPEPQAGLTLGGRIGREGESVAVALVYDAVEIYQGNAFTMGALGNFPRFIALGIIRCISSVDTTCRMCRLTAGPICRSFAACRLF